MEHSLIPPKANIRATSKGAASLQGCMNTIGGPHTLVRGITLLTGRIDEDARWVAVSPHAIASARHQLKLPRHCHHSRGRGCHCRADPTSSRSVGGEEEARRRIGPVVVASRPAAASSIPAVAAWIRVRRVDPGRRHVDLRPPRRSATAAA